MAETTWKQLSEDIVALMESSGLPLGRIHQYERWMPEWEQFLNLMRCEMDGNSIIRGWEVVRRSVDTEWLSFGHNYMRTYHFVLVGWFGLSDANQSALSAQDLSDRLMDYFDGLSAMVSATPFLVGPCSMPSFEDVMFGDVLCHRVEIRLPIKVEKNL